MEKRSQIQMLADWQNERANKQKDTFFFKGLMSCFEIRIPCMMEKSTKGSV